MSLEVHIEKKLNGFTLRSDFTAGNTATAILGASGCGKSMTLRCIAGIVKPDKGRIVLDGRVLFDSEQHIDLPPQQRGVGLLFQNYALFPNMTVEQNILCGLKAERDKAARKARCAGMLRALRLEDLADRRPAELSGGQQQRTALARILVGKPKILMLDEPFSALDSYLREEVEGEVGSLLAGFDGTALLVTHNRDEAYRLCRDMIVMDGGQVLRTGTTKEVFADPHSTAAARLTGCKNILPCTRVDAHSVRLTGCESLLHLAAEVPEGCTAVGIRAHDFAPCAPGAENALPVELLSASENPFDWNLIFQLPDGTTRLWWKVSKTTLSVAEPDAPACLSALRRASWRWWIIANTSSKRQKSRCGRTGSCSVFMTHRRISWQYRHSAWHPWRTSPRRSSRRTLASGQRRPPSPCSRALPHGGPRWSPPCS